VGFAFVLSLKDGRGDFAFLNANQPPFGSRIEASRHFPSDQSVGVTCGVRARDAPPTGHARKRIVARGAIPRGSAVVCHAVTPETFIDVVQLLVPELQRRGRYKVDYRPETLRD
jgi:hypothetical protein